MHIEYSKYSIIYSFVTFFVNHSKTRGRRTLKRKRRPLAALMSNRIFYIFLDIENELMPPLAQAGA